MKRKMQRPAEFATRFQARQEAQADGLESPNYLRQILLTLPAFTQQAYTNSGSSGGSVLSMTKWTCGSYAEVITTQL